MLDAAPKEVPAVRQVSFAPGFRSKKITFAFPYATDSRHFGPIEPLNDGETVRAQT
jgi:hypothetical protein